MNINKDIAEGDTERTTLVDISADNAATYYYRLKYPAVYKSVRYPQGHPVIVIMMDGSRQIDEVLAEMKTPKKVVPE